ncbi:MAG: glycosyltransferase family 1 protein [Candidatus Komeilibacteria bacterium]|nr:glycosyltransferase family 1 protein [Candidatus Komeilibacteria bacterium]
MKIGIDARLYGTKYQGLGRYVKKLVDGLAESDQENSYTVFLTPDNFDDFKTANLKFKKVLLPARWYSFKEQWLAPKIINKERLDLMHFPHFNAPYFYAGRFIITLHDLIINHFPDSRATTLPKWLYQFKLWAYRISLKRTVNKAEKIIVPSQFVKDDVVKHYPAAAAKVKVIYEGYFLDEDQQAVNIDRFKITKPFLLYVGSAYPHKNLRKLIAVFKQLNRQKNYQLVLVGRHDYFYRRLQQEAGDDPDIIFTGYLADSELAALYGQARLYVFPSSYEGFGLPPLEAQAHGLPVASANSSCLPEVLGQAAIYFDPKNETEMLAAIKKVLNDEKLRSQLSLLGQKNIARFSWETMVKQTQALYLS